MRGLWRCTLVLGLLAGGAAGAEAQSRPSPAPAATRSSRDGVFTPEQAARGNRVREQACSTCHSPAEWSRDGFLGAWSGRSARDLFERLRTTMPYDFPGSLSRQQYVDLVAYILKLNGAPAGREELKPDDAALRQVLIQKP